MILNREDNIDSVPNSLGRKALFILHNKSMICHNKRYAPVVLRKEKTVLNL